MQFNLFSFRKFIILFTAYIFIFGCANLGYMMGKTPIPSIGNSISITGKFKASYADSKETGYFTINKSKELYEVTIGKNFLLPEKEFIFSSDEIINIHKLIGIQNRKDLEKLNFLNISVNELLGILTGFNNFDNDNFSVRYPDSLKKDGKSQFQKNIIIYNDIYNLEILVKKLL